MPRDILSISIAVRIPAPAIAGIANKNENLAASSADRPIIKPVQIVAPERDIPGMMANAKIWLLLQQIDPSLSLCRL